MRRLTALLLLAAALAAPASALAAEPSAACPEVIPSGMLCDNEGTGGVLLPDLSITSVRPDAPPPLPDAGAKAPIDWGFLSVGVGIAVLMAAGATVALRRSARG